MSGKGVIEHNRRTYIAENVDPERTHLNIEYCYTPIEQAYHELFDEALAAYNAKEAKKTIAELKDTITDLKGKLAAATKELAEYKSVRGRLRTAELEQENDNLRSKLRSYETIIDRNNLWLYFSRHRGKMPTRDDTR